MSVFTVLNPATEEPVTTVTQVSAEQADEAIARAAAAQATWRDVAPGDRAKATRGPGKTGSGTAGHTAPRRKIDSRDQSRLLRPAKFFRRPGTTRLTIVLDGLSFELLPRLKT